MTTDRHVVAVELRQHARHYTYIGEHEWAISLHSIARRLERVSEIAASALLPRVEWVVSAVARLTSKGMEQ